MKEYELIEYSKDLATSVSGLSSYEMDVLLTIAYTFKQSIKNFMPDTSNDLEINVNPLEVKEVLKKSGNVSNARLRKAIENLFDTKYFFKKDSYIEAHHIFKKMRFTEDCKNIYLVLNKEYIPIFFHLSGNFTQHSILIFNSLKGKYSKKIYQLIMSYKDLRSWRMTAKDFKLFLEITEKYTWTNINARCIKPALKELIEKTDIAEFKIDKIKNRKIVTDVIITWRFKGEKIEEEPIIETKQEFFEPLTATEINLFNILNKMSPKEYPKPMSEKGSYMYTAQIRTLLKQYNEKMKMEE